MILLAALLCNYGRGKCLNDIGTEGCAKQAEERALAGDRWQEWGLVFTSSIGTPIEACNLNHRFQRLAKLAQLPKVRFHDLRHTAATLLLAQGVHPRLIMETLGHSSITLTMNTYSHVIPAMQAEVAAQMDGILAPRAAKQAVPTEVSTRGISEPVATSVATIASQRFSKCVSASQ
jgi:site-specific recombinase XerC